LVSRHCGAEVSLLDSAALATRFPWLNTASLSLGSMGERWEGFFDPWQLLQVRAASLCVTHLQAGRGGGGGGTPPNSLQTGAQSWPGWPCSTSQTPPGCRCQTSTPGAGPWTRYCLGRPQGAAPPGGGTRCDSSCSQPPWDRSGSCQRRGGRTQEGHGPGTRGMCVGHRGGKRKQAWGRNSGPT
jgi:hypothetical protein